MTVTKYFNNLQELLQDLDLSILDGEDTVIKKGQKGERGIRHF